MTETLSVILALLTFVLNTLDVYTTNKILSHGGVELNKFMAFLMKLMGDWWFLYKYVISVFALIAALTLPSPALVGALVLANGVLGWAVVHNYLVIRRNNWKL